MSLALWYDGRSGARVADAPLGDGGLALRALHSAISRGTERLVWSGQVPASLAQTMRCPHQRGDFPGPVAYGYAMVAADPRGRPGFVLHPHQDRFEVAPDAFHPLPDGLPPARAVLAPNAETALNAVWDGQVLPGDRVTVVGAGVVGALTASFCARVPGTEVTLVDRLEDRRPVAEALGCAFELPEHAPIDQDVVFHASASEAGLATALGCAGVEATVVELSWYGDRPVAAPLGHGFHPLRLTLRSSQVGRIPPTRAPRWSYRRRIQTALALLRDDRLDVLIDTDIAFAALPDALPGLFAGQGLCARVHY